MQQGQMLPSIQHMPPFFFYCCASPDVQVYTFAKESSLPFMSHLKIKILQESQKEIKRKKSL